MFKFPRPALLLEDSPQVARALARLLAAHGFSVTTAGSCADALVLRTVFQVGVFDIELPDGCGVDVARVLLARKLVARVIFCTAGTSRAAMQAARKLGPVVAKPDANATLPTLLQAAPETTANAGH